MKLLYEVYEGGCAKGLVLIPGLYSNIILPHSALTSTHNNMGCGASSAAANVVDAVSGRREKQYKIQPETEKARKAQILSQSLLPYLPAAVLQQYATSSPLVATKGT